MIEGDHPDEVDDQKMEPKGIEPLTSAMPLRRSTN